MAGLSPALAVYLASVLTAPAPAARADQFDHYTNPVLAKAVEDGKLMEVKELTADVIAEYSGVLPDTSATFLVVQTNDRRFAKLLVRAARQKVGKDVQVPMLLVEKYVTYREGTERAIQARGQNLHLFPGTRLHLDFGQVVPERVGGDLLVPEGKPDSLSITVRPLKDAKLFVLTKPIPGVQPKRADKLVIGERFEPRYFNGTFKLHDDGRRSGTLTLKVSDSGEVTGSFYSDRDGQKYDVTGRLGTVRHAIAFTVKFPRVEQTFQGMMFTGNGKVIAGTSKLQDREAGFYAERIEGD